MNNVLQEDQKIKEHLASAKTIAMVGVSSIKKENSSIKVKLLIIDDNSKSDNLNKIKDVLNKNHSKYLIINHKKEEHKEKIFENTNDQTFSNLSSLLKCFETAKKENSDLIFFVEDDYLHFENSLTDMINTYERVSSQIEKDIIICPCDYPFNYMSNEKNILSKFAHRIVDKGMTVPALFFLESTKYVSFIGSQIMVFFGPMLTSFINSEKYYNFSELLENVFFMVVAESWFGEGVDNKVLSVSEKSFKALVSTPFISFGNM